MAKAAVKIQAVYKGFKSRKEKAQEEEAAKKIQSVFKGFNVRKKRLQPAVTITLTSPDDDHWYGYDEDEYYNQPQEDMPDLNCPDVARAVVQIQKAYRGFQVRKTLKKSKSDEDLPDLKDPEVAKSAVKIQSVFRGFQTRKKMEEEMPDLKCAKVARAAIRIQKVYRGFQARKHLKEQNELPDLKDPAMKDA